MKTSVLNFNLYVCILQKTFRLNSLILHCVIIFSTSAMCLSVDVPNRIRCIAAWRCKHKQATTFFLFWFDFMFFILCTTTHNYTTAAAYIYIQRNGMEENVRFPVQLVYIKIVIIVCDTTWKKDGEKLY